MPSTSAKVAGFVGALLAVGCSHKAAPHPPGDEGPDAQIEDDAAVDAEADAPSDEDAEVDASEPPLDAGNLSECAGDLFSFVGARSVGRPFSAEIIGNRTHLVYVAPSGGGTSGDNVAQGLRYASFDTTEPPPEPSDLVNIGDDLYDRTRDPSLVAHDGALRLFYTAAVAGNPFELFSMDPGADDPPIQRTQDAAVMEVGNAAGTFGDDVAVVFSAESTAGAGANPVSFLIDGKSTHELVPASAGFSAVQLAYAELATSAARSGLAAFVSASTPGIYAQHIGEDGEPSGELLTLTQQIGASSNVAIATGRDAGGALIYTESVSGNVHQLRFREIDTDGVVSDSPRSLTSANQNLRDVAIAAYSHGYVIAYRRLGGGAAAPASIYLMFVDAQGNVAGTRLVQAAATTGGGLSVLVANDGRLVVVWADHETVTEADAGKVEVELAVRVARLTCAL